MKTTTIQLCDECTYEPHTADCGCTDDDCCVYHETWESDAEYLSAIL